MSLLDDSIIDLLHIDEPQSNKLLDLRGRSPAATYILSRAAESDFTAFMLDLVRRRIGKPGNTALLGSALNAAAGEQIVGRNVNAVDWADGNGVRDPKALDSFIDTAYRDLSLKGNNPMFLGLGALEWRVSAGRDEYVDVTTPLVIFPVLLLRGGASSPVHMQFVDDDIYLNPCLFAKMRSMPGMEEVADGFPRPDPEKEADEPIDLASLTPEYFTAVEKYVDECRRSDETVFRFRRGMAAVAVYDHGDVCMYYDIRANRARIDADGKICRIFTKAESLPPPAEPKRGLMLPLARDSVQENIIGRIAAGESLIVKGPPGTGKTQTIANIIAALTGEGKSILFASKKLSALGEVYAKLPAQLRPFVMLLESETAAQAAKMRPENVTADLRALLRARSSYSQPGEAVYGKKRRGREACSEAARFIEKYRGLMFGARGAAGLSYYDVIDAACREDLPLVPFVAPETAAATGVRDYESALAAVTEAEVWLPRMTDDGRHTADVCPYMGITDKTDIESARSALISAAESAKDALAATAGYSEISPLTLGGLTALCRRKFTREEARTVRGLSEEAAEDVRKAFAACPEKPKAVFEAFDGMLEAYAELNAAADGAAGMTLRELKLLVAEKDVFSGADGKPMSRAELNAAKGIADAADKFTDDAVARYYNSAAALKRREELTEDERREVVNAAAAVAKYENTDRIKPGVFDLAAKKAVKILRGFCYMDDVSFGDLVRAACEFARAAKSEEEAVKLYGRLCAHFRRRLTPDQEKCVRLLLRKTGAEPSDFFAAASEALEAAAKCAVADDSEDITPRELADKFADGMKVARLAETLKNAETCGEPLVTAEALLALRSLSDEGASNAEALALSDRADAAADAAEKTRAALSAFGVKYFANGLTRRARLADLAALVDEADDRSVADAALRYRRALDASPVSLSALMRPVESGKITDTEPKRLFEHNFFRAAAEGMAMSLGGARNGLGAAAAEALQKFADGEREIAEADVSIIESLCMSRIDPNSKAFAFLGSERSAAPSSLRRLFKDHGDAIRQLKRCFILSSATASLLMRSPEYFDFDVAIVDEASQLEPAGILPVLMRAKQCVIVGDEWQMPPINDFRASSRAEGVPDDGDFLEPNASALGVALRNEAFRVCELVCHYRSKTESLIAFSQRMFYPYMRTFPAAVPRVEGDLGFTDIYVENAACRRGENRKEAEAVVECVRRHFEKYYDEKKGTLSRSFGVVAFGEPQIKLIKSLAERDGWLGPRMRKALAAFDDVEERLMFFKTIRTVQGQETEDLFLSLTYGRSDEGGLSQAFGTLNRSELGRCVFNVSVTRARSSVTVVHSIEAADLTNENISYIRDYLRLAERFSVSGADQFVSETPPPGFLRSVGQYIVSLGVPEDRVVYNYGVTGGSVKIPIAVLGGDKTRAAIGVWCERGGGAYDYYDCNMRYYESLVSRGWTLHRVSAHDWSDNAEAERRSLADAVRRALTGTDA